jgi:hypothetical protein
LTIISDFLKNYYKPTKINIATLGNIVRQLHIHIQARFENDRAWPQALFGTTPELIFTDVELENVKSINEYNKKVIVNNTAINEELSNLFQEYKSNFIYFERYKDIISLIKNISNEIDFIIMKDVKKRSWVDVVNETELVFNEVFEKKIDFNITTNDILL